MIALAARAWGQPSSVLSAGQWYKFSVSSDGVYKIDYATLQKAGINPAQINPKNLRLYTGQPGQLPQANAVPRVNDLQELAISVVGEADGQFNAGDYITFFAQGPDTYTFDLKRNFFNYQNNPYTVKNFYFLTVAQTPGKRIAPVSVRTGNFPVIAQFDDFAYYENTLTNLLHSGRQWFGEQFDQNPTLTVQFSVPGIVPQSPIKIASHVMAQSVTQTSFNVSFNGNAILTQTIPPIPNTRYGITGILASDTASVSESSVNGAAQTTQQVKYQFNKGGPGISVGYLDYFLFTMERKLSLYGNQTIFTSAASTANPVSLFQVGAVAATHQVWDVTNLFAAKNQMPQLDGTTFSFATNTDTLKKFVVFDPAKIPAPKFESALANQNLHAIASADLLIISYPAFLSQASRLAAFRQSHNQLTPVVVTTDAIFNEYGGGKPDVTSIRDFIRDVYQKTNSKLKFVLLFGRGSYDYQNKVEANTNYVPIYESYESLDPLATYSSDDYFGFLEDNEGSWPENPAVNYSMDVGIGRIPAKTQAEAQVIVDKLIEYDTDPGRFGAWTNDFLFVGDDGDFNIHQSQADTLATRVEQTNPYFNAKKLFVDSYPQTSNANGPLSPQASKALDLAVRAGKVIVNYTGHGSEYVWTQQQILDPTLVQSWNNGPRYPLFVTATCEFGRNDDPGIISSAELAILQPHGGAIGLVTTARPVNSGTNFQLNQAFYKALFTKTNNNFRPLGAIVRDTKNNSVSGVSNRNFSLLGDPSMNLALPNNQVVVTQIKNSSGTDTLKALSRVTITGEVQALGSQLSNFNGTLAVSIYDQIQHFVTPGNPSNTWNPPAPPYPFAERANLLFQGSTTVHQGSFQFDFVVPDNLVTGYGPGKFSGYAFSDAGITATGGTTQFVVGGKEALPPADVTPPAIRLFVSDTTFSNGGTVSPNTQLVALLSDVSGINTATVNPQNAIVARLDNKWEYVVSDYFSCADQSFSNGTVIYPLDTLSKGAHQLTLSASDTYNNRSTATVRFAVGGTGITINDFSNYPNPFDASQQSTHFRFTHSRAGEDLDVTLTIYDLNGKILTTLGYTLPSSTYQEELGAWNGKSADGIKFDPGLYVARLFVRSLADGSQNQRATKLIILN